MLRPSSLHLLLCFSQLSQMPTSCIHQIRSTACNQVILNPLAPINHHPTAPSSHHFFLTLPSQVSTTRTLKEECLSNDAKLYLTEGIAPGSVKIKLARLYPTCVAHVYARVKSLNHTSPPPPGFISFSGWRVLLEVLPSHARGSQTGPSG